MSATLVLPDYTGRLGNRLILHAHVLAAAMELRCRVWNLSLLPAAHYFEGLHLNPLCSYPQRHFPADFRWAIRPVRRGIEEWVRACRRRGTAGGGKVVLLDRENRRVLDLAGKPFAHLVRRHPLLVLWGYSFRCPKLLRKHAAEIRRHLRVRKEFAEAGPEPAGRPAPSRRIVVHIRQGDFRTWQEGKFYRSPRCMAQALHRLIGKDSGKRRQVWVCSDEPVPHHLFPPGTKVETRELGRDLWLLTNATDVVSARSTLAAWAAFQGGARHWLVDCKGGLHLQKPGDFFTKH